MQNRSKKTVIAALFGNLGIAGTLSLREGDHKFLHAELISHPGLKTMHFSSEDVLVILAINYQDNLIVAKLERVNDGIERKIKDINPGAEVYLEAEGK